MKTLPCVGVFAGLLFAGAGAGAEADAAQKKQQAHTVKGHVVEVHASAKEAGAGTVTLKVHNKKSGASHDVKIHIGANTKIEKIGGKKGNKTHTPASFAALHKGETVVVHSVAGHPHQAQSVAIVAHGNKKAIAAN